jgi:MSHA biogenesis protein MshQ
MIIGMPSAPCVDRHHRVAVPRATRARLSSFFGLVRAAVGKRVPIVLKKTPGTWLLGLFLGALAVSGGALAAPNFQAISAIAAAQNGGADPTVTLPAHAAGDVFLLATIVRSSSSTVATPAGWTSIGSATRSTVATYQFFWKRAASASETNPVINRTNTVGDVYAAVTVYRGAVTTGDPWEVKGTITTGTTDPSVISGITTLTADSLVVVAVAGEDDNNNSITTTGTNPTAYTEHYLEANVGSDGTVTFSEAARTAAGATGNVSVNWNSGVPVGFGGIVLALKPATTYYSRASANWGTASTWSTADCGGSASTQIPPAGSDVVICAGDTVTLNQNSGSLASLTIQSTGVLNIGNNTTARTLAVTGDISNSGTLRYNTNAAHVITVDGQFIVDATGTFTSAAVAGAKTLTVTGLISNANVFQFAGTAAMTVNANGGITNTGTFNVLTTSNVTHALNLKGNLSNSGTFQLATDANSLADTVLNDSSSQTIGGTAAPAFNDLTISNAAGVSLTQDVTVNGTLTLTNGVVSTGSSVLSVTSACQSNVVRTSGWVAGSLRLQVPTGSFTCTWPVGDAAGYRPIGIVYTTVSAAGQVTGSVSQSAGEHPNIATSTIDPAFDVNRYWTLSNSSTAFTSAVATFTYVAGDVDGGADSTSFIAGRFAGGTWTYPASTAAASSVQVSGLTGATLSGDFALGENTPVPFSYYRMDEGGGWNGTTGEVVDSGTGGLNGTARSLSATKPTTTATSPAISGTPGTCQYGVFNRSNKDYVELPSGYPNLVSAAGGFTITAWIRPTDASLPGQRIFIDDEGSGTGSWGFSVGETDATSGGGTGPGGVRFYYRQPTVFILDTAPITSSNGQWVFVALSVQLAAGTNASRASIYVYNTSGTLIQTRTNTWTWTAGTDPGLSTIGGETNASAEGTNQFGFGGNIDELRVYRTSLSQARINVIRQETHPCALLNHIRIDHGGIGLTCSPQSVTVRACTDTTCSSTYAGSVTTTLTPTGWVGGDTITFTGTTTAQLRKTTVGTVTLGATGTTPAATTATRCFVGATETCSMEFKDSGFIFDVPNVTACKPSGTVTIQAVRKDATTQTCAPAFSGTKTVNFWSTYSSPATGTKQVTVNSTSVTTASPGTGVSLNFDATATATFSVTYPDAGQMQLNARYTGSGAEAGLVMDGNDLFVSAPYSLYLAKTEPDPAGVCTAGDATCNKYKKAGENIPMTLNAVCWQTDGDTDLSNNPLTPNFAMANIPLSHTLVAPAGGQAGTIGATSISMAASDNGTKSFNQTVTEVGVFRFAAAPAAAGYFGLTVPGNTTPNIGRIYPDHFDISAGTVTPACSSGTPFTYMGQDMNLSFQLQASSSGGTATQNYTGSFAKLTSTSQLGFGAVSGGTNLTSRVLNTAAPISFPAMGIASVTTTLQVGRATPDNPDGPFTPQIGVAPVDADGVSLLNTALNMDVDATGGNDHRQIGSASALRFGRLRMSNAFGSQLVGLLMPIRTEYWNGTTFVTNADDSCTVLARSNVTLSNYQGNLNACETAMPATIPFSAGVGKAVLSAPGSVNNGSVDLRVNLNGVTGNFCTGVGGSESPVTSAGRAYLLGRWNNADNDGKPSTSYDDDPVARATFGVYRGSEEVIHVREN